MPVGWIILGALLLAVFVSWAWSAYHRPEPLGKWAVWVEIDGLGAPEQETLALFDDEQDARTFASQQMPDRLGLRSYHVGRV